MNVKQISKIAGYGLMIFAIMYMVYCMNQPSNDDTTYISMGLLLTVVGMFLAQYGSDKKE